MFSLKADVMRDNSSNPYQSPTSPHDTTQIAPLLTSGRREWLTFIALVLTSVCIVAVYVVGIAQLPAPFWDRLGPEIYHAVTVMNLGLLIIGLASWCVVVMFGKWKHRLLAVCIAFAYAPFLPGLVRWITR